MKVLLTDLSGLTIMMVIGQDKHLGRQTFDAYPFFLSIDLFDLKNMINDL